jgi:hypothetical protein
LPVAGQENGANVVVVVDSVVVVEVVVDWVEEEVIPAVPKYTIAVIVEIKRV